MRTPFDPDDAGHEHRGRGRGRRRGGFGPMPFGGFGPGFGPPFRRGAGRARRGDVRAAVLALLAEEPMHGYQLMQEIAQRSAGVWKPSAGSVYPALSQLEDEGLVQPQAGSEGDSGRKVFGLTDEGRQYVQDHADEVSSPWDEVMGGVPDGMAETMGLVRDVHVAAMQVLRTGDSALVEKASRVLASTRRSLYLVLAGEPDEGSDSGS